MPYTPPTVNYCATQNGTYVNLTGIQSVQIVRGRTYVQDNFQASTCMIELIPAASYSPALAIGQFIDVRVTNSATARAYFCGKITDVRRTYQMPYDSGTGLAPSDRIIITATGGTGLMAKYTFPSGALTGLPTGIIDAAECTFQQSQAATLAGVFLTPTSVTTVQSSAITVAGQGCLDIVNKIARTAQNFVDDADNQRDTIGSYAGQVAATVTPPLLQNAAFSDTGAIKYSALSFYSSAENVFNQVNVYPDGLATQSQSGTAPYNSLDYYTTNATTADGASLAGLLYNLFNSLTTPAPFTLSTNTAVDNTWAAVAQLTSSAGDRSYLGAAATVTFRGATYTAQIQKIAVTFYPDIAYLSVTMSPSLGTAFTLDSSQFGILDSNRLGYP